MSKHQDITPMPHDQVQEPGLNTGLDCETLTLLRLFLQPIMEGAADWRELVSKFKQKGYGVGLRGDRLVVLNADGDPICTGTSLGVPLVQIMHRIGPPSHSLPRL